MKKVIDVRRRLFFFVIEKRKIFMSFFSPESDKIKLDRNLHLPEKNIMHKLCIFVSIFHLSSFYVPLMSNICYGFAWVKTTFPKINNSEENWVAVYAKFCMKNFHHNKRVNSFFKSLNCFVFVYLKIYYCFLWAWN